MGRLVDSVMAALGLKPSDRVVISHEPIDTHLTNKTPGETPSQNKTEVPVATKPKYETRLAHGLTHNQKSSSPEGISKEDPIPVVKTSEEESDHPSDEPVEKDCLSCRYVGAGVGLFGAAYVGRTCYKSYEKYPQGSRRYAFIGFSGTLITIMLTMAIGNVFQIGLFNPDRSKFSFNDHLKQDFQDIQNVLGYRSSVEGKNN